MENTPDLTSPILPPDQSPHEHTRETYSKLPWILAIIATLLLGMAIGSFYLGDRFDQKSPLPKSHEVRIVGEEIDAVSIYKKSEDKVAHITATVKSSPNFFGETRDGEATGSGFLIDEEGHLITNAHVVQNATDIKVSFDGKKQYDADLVGADLTSDTAVLKIDPPDNITPLSFTDSKELQVGEPVIAIGNPLSLDRTATTGIISALGREIQAPNGFTISGVIQTDAAINPGNSGGPLFNRTGDVIGVNSQIATSGQDNGSIGIGFAIPSNTVKEIATELIEKGKISRARIGVSGQAISPALARILNLPIKTGVMLAQVTPGSPADKAKLRAGEQMVQIENQTYVLGGDVITKFDGKDVETMQELADLVNTHEVGDKIKIEYYRGDDKKTTTVVLDERPEDDMGE